MANLNENDQSPTIVSVTAPAGRLGLMLTTTFCADSGHPFVVVSSLKESSPLIGKLFPGDRILKVDEENVEKLTNNVDVISIIQSSEERERILTVSRSEICKEWVRNSNGVEMEGEHHSPEDVTSNITSSPKGTNKAENQISPGYGQISVTAPQGPLGITLRAQGDKGSESSCIVIDSVKESSPIYGKILPGDRINKINGKTVSNITDIYEMKAVIMSMNRESRIFILTRSPGQILSQEEGFEATLQHVKDPPELAPRTVISPTVNNPSKNPANWWPEWARRSSKSNLVEQQGKLISKSTKKKHHLDGSIEIDEIVTYELENGVKKTVRTTKWENRPQYNESNDPKRSIYKESSYRDAQGSTDQVKDAETTTGNHKPNHSNDIEQGMESDKKVSHHNVDDDAPMEVFGCAKGMKRDRHFKHLVLYLSLLIYVIAWMAVSAKYQGVDCGSYRNDCHLFAESPLLAWVFFFLIYGFYLAEAFCMSSTYKYLKSINTSESIIDYMQRLYNTTPRLVLNMSCYHYETRLVTRYDSKGNPYTTTETVPVTTWVGSEKVEIVRWKDDSAPLQWSEIEKYQITKVKISKTFDGDEGFEIQKNNFIESNRYRDVFFNYGEDLQIDGFTSHCMSYVDLSKKPEFLSVYWYIGTVITIFFAFPYRAWISSITDKVSTNVHKIIWTS